MKDIAALLHDDGSTVAIVGATDNPAKYGAVIYRDLKRKGYEVFAVNPHRATVDGDPAYPDLESLPVTPTVVNFVVPAPQTLKVLEEARSLGIDNVWVQPGAESPAVLTYLQEHGFNYLANSCIMVRTRLKTSS